MLSMGSEAQDHDPALRFSIPEGRVLNEFYRQGPVAAHLVLTSGSRPRLVLAFPAGNSGVALWFDALPGTLTWLGGAEIAAVSRNVAGGSLRGVSAELEGTGSPLTIRHAILSNVRVIRDYGYTGKTPPEVLVAPQLTDDTLVWQRRRLDGDPGYYLSIEVLEGEISGGGSQPIMLSPDPNGQLRLRLTGLTGDLPLTPIPGDELLVVGAPADAQLRRALAFLSYREKLLAGSWRFNTYFGRDTLMSMRLLAPVAQLSLMEAGLGAVLGRLNDAGEVAHEEDIGEFAVLRRLREQLPPGDTPILDYKMIDDDYMLAPVAAHYLLDMTAGRERAQAFLARRTASGTAYGARLARNLLYVMANAAPFAREPIWQRLIELKPGWNVGNWRDSERGLGGGRYPYDINGVLVPAALEATARMLASGLLEPYLDEDEEAALGRAASMAEIWRHQAPPYFDVVLDSRVAKSEASDYARRIGIDAEPALAALDGEGVRFRAVALDAKGQPVPVQNSDEAMALLFLDLPPAEAARIAASLTQPFPAGLLTGVGLVVANPAYAAESLEPAFGRDRYHGTVIWSWQQALLAAGIDRQLARCDLGQPERALLQASRMRLRAAIGAAEELRGSELWSWSAEAGDWRAVPFGQGAQHETESNAAQLWSTVYLAQP